MELNLLLSGFLVVLVPYIAILVSPGPDMIMIMRNSLMYSKRSGLFASLGIATSITLHSSYTVLGLGLLIKESPMVFNTIRALGAVYLLYIGYSSFRSGVPVQSDLDTPKAQRDLTPFQAFKNGFLSNALNPMAILFFMTTLASIMGPEITGGMQTFYVATLGLLAFAWFATVAVILTLPTIQKQFLKLGAWIGRLAGSVLVYFGLKAAHLLIKAF